MGRWPITLQERVFEKLFEAASIATFSRQVRDLYEDSLKYYRDIKNVVDTAKVEGLEEGIELGKELEKIEMAKTMKADGLPISTIIKYTGLSEDEVRKL